MNLLTTHIINDGREMLDVSVDLQVYITVKRHSNSEQLIFKDWCSLDGLIDNETVKYMKNECNAMLAKKITL